MTIASRGDSVLLRIGDLSARTGVSTRMLRYYESQGLIEAERSPRGHRLFDPVVTHQIYYVKMLLAAGLPTRVIGELLDCVRGTGKLASCAVPTLLDHLRSYDRQIASLIGTREALQGLVDASTSGAELGTG